MWTFLSVFIAPGERTGRGMLEGRSDGKSFPLSWSDCAGASSPFRGMESTRPMCRLTQRNGLGTFVRGAR